MAAVPDRVIALKLTRWLAMFFVRLNELALCLFVLFVSGKVPGWW